MCLVSITCVFVHTMPSCCLFFVLFYVYLIVFLLFSSMCIVSFAKHVSGYECIAAAAGSGHLDAVIFLHENLGASFDMRGAMLAAAGGGHLHVIQLLMTQGDVSAPIAFDLFECACENDHVSVIEWLLSTYNPRSARISNAPELVMNTKHTRLLDTLSSYLGETHMLERFSRLRDNLSPFSAMGPVVVEWCMHRGMRFTDSHFHSLIVSGYESVHRQGIACVEGMMRLGATWHVEYFQMAAMHNDVAFCDWAHKQGLELDLKSFVVPLHASLAMLTWLASVGVYMRTD